MLVAALFISSNPYSNFLSAEDNSGTKNVIIMDQGAAENKVDLDLLESIITLISVNDEKLFASGIYGESNRRISKIMSIVPKSQILEDLAMIKGYDAKSKKSDQLGNLSEIYSYLSNNDAKFGSKIYLITNGKILGESENTKNRFLDLSDLFKKEGWTIDILMLPSSEISVREIFKSISDNTNGKFYDLGDSYGVNSLLNDITGSKFQEILNVNLSKDVPTLKSFDIPPHTSELKVILIKKPSIFPELYMPDGKQIKKSTANISINRTQNFDFFSIENPDTGKWLIRADGENSYFRSLVNFKNEINITYIGDAVYPVSEEILLEIKIDNLDPKIVISNSKREALIKDPTGKVAMYEFFDTGYNGDKIESDGIYSTKFLPNQNQGINDAELRISWDSSSAIITHEFSFRTEYFPYINLVADKSVEVQLDEKIYIGQITTKKSDYPYYVSTDEIKLEVFNEFLESDTIIELLPIDVVEEEKYWKFNIFVIFPDTGLYKINASLSGKYLDKAYSSNLPNEAIDVKILVPFSETLMQYIRMGLFVIFFLTILVGGLFFYFSRFAPYGRLLDDQDNLIVDFKKLNRPLNKLIFSRNRIYATEIYNLPFSGGVFIFRKKGIILEKDPKINDPSIRVNGIPSTDIIELDHNVVLGVAGRLIRLVKD